MKYATFATEAEALAACQRIDASLGYPRMEQGEQGPPVLTERWATPIEMADGTWAVPMLEQHLTAARLTKAALSRDAAAIATARKPVAEYAEVKPIGDVKPAPGGRLA
jgi:hypothetical protein